MSIPFALSLSKYVNSAGTDVGFASLLAVALLALLYFAGARESRTLRHQLEDAQNRISALEARLSQVIRGQSRPVGPQATQAGQITQPPSLPGRPGVVPAPTVSGAPLVPAGSAVARVPREATGVALVSATGVLLGAPAGAGAPSLGSATKLIPSPQPASAPQTAPTPLAVPAAATVAAGATMASPYVEAEDEDYLDEFEPDDTMYVRNGGLLAANGGGGGGPAIAAPPRMEFGGDEPAGPLPRRTIPTVPSGPSGPRRVAGRLVGAIIAVIVIAAIVVALLLVTSSGSSKKGTSTQAAHTTTHAKTKKTQKTAAIKPALIKVSVLNGTAIGGLATDVGAQLRSAGYTVPDASVTNASVQTEASTTVAYRPGSRAAAFQVAQSIEKSNSVSITQVVPASAASIASCATPVGGTEATCPAKVIVTIGTDLSSAANSSSATG